MYIYDCIYLYIYINRELLVVDAELFNRPPCVGSLGRRCCPGLRGVVCGGSSHPAHLLEKSTSARPS